LLFWAKYGGKGAVLAGILMIYDCLEGAYVVI
jgi:hypothetical protein